MHCLSRTPSRRRCCCCFVLITYNIYLIGKSWQRMDVALRQLGPTRTAALISRQSPTQAFLDGHNCGHFMRDDICLWDCPSRHARLITKTSL